MTVSKLSKTQQRIHDQATLLGKAAPEPRIAAPCRVWENRPAEKRFALRPYKAVRCCDSEWEYWDEEGEAWHAHAPDKAVGLWAYDVQIHETRVTLWQRFVLAVFISVLVIVLALIFTPQVVQNLVFLVGAAFVSYQWYMLRILLRRLDAERDALHEMRRGDEV